MELIKPIIAVVIIIFGAYLLFRAMKWHREKGFRQSAVHEQLIAARERRAERLAVAGESQKRSLEDTIESVRDLTENLKLKKDLLKVIGLTDAIKRTTQKEILKIESEIDTRFLGSIKDFLISPEYSVIKKAVTHLKNGNELDYVKIKNHLGPRWSFTTNQISTLVSNEMEKQGLSYSFLQHQAEKRTDFLNSSGYKYIKQFAAKYGETGKTVDFRKLQEVLFNWQWEFSLDDLTQLVYQESKRQSLENLATKLLSGNPHNRGAILKTYLDFYRSNDDFNLKNLADFLEGRYSASVDVSSLRNELQTIEKRIELEIFEQRLSEGDEQINLTDIDILTGYEFEDFLKTLFSKMGYQVERTRLSGDQGADLVVIKFGEKKVVQAKRLGGKVGNYAVQEIMAAISLYQARRGMVITNNYFTPAAKELAAVNGIELIDRDGLDKMISKHW